MTVWLKVCSLTSPGQCRSKAWRARKGALIHLLLEAGTLIRGHPLNCRLLLQQQGSRSNEPAPGQEVKPPLFGETPRLPTAGSSPSQEVDPGARQPLAPRRKAGTVGKPTKGVLGRESSHRLCGTQRSARHTLRALKKSPVVVALARCDLRHVRCRGQTKDLPAAPSSQSGREVPSTVAGATGVLTE